MAVICCFYCFVGVHRLVYGGWNLYVGDEMKYWLLHRSYNPLDTAWGLGRWMTGNAIAYRIFLVGFFVTTLFEALSPLCLVSPKFRRLWLAAILGFHVLSPFVMCINFWENCALLVVFVRFDWWCSKDEATAANTAIANRSSVKTLMVAPATNNGG